MKPSSHVHIGHVLRAVHHALDGIVDLTCHGVSRDNARVIEVRMAVPGMMIEEWKDRQIDVIAAQDYILARSGVDEFSLIVKRGSSRNLAPNLFQPTFERERIHGA